MALVAAGSCLSFEHSALAPEAGRSTIFEGHRATADVALRAALPTPKNTSLFGEGILVLRSEEATLARRMGSQVGAGDTANPSAQQVNSPIESVREFAASELLVAELTTNPSPTPMEVAAAPSDELQDPDWATVKADELPSPATRLDPQSAARAVGEGDAHQTTTRQDHAREGAGPVGPVSVAQEAGETATVDGGTNLASEPDFKLTSSAPQMRTLQQALARTYQTNPNLMARRAELRGLDNMVALKRSERNPQISVGATYGQELYITRPLGGRGRALGANVDYSQIVFAGGAIGNSIRSARTRVIAGRADLRAIEGNILTEAVASYADILRDREIRDLSRSQVRILQANLESTRARFLVRDLTLADLAQSEARLESAQSNLATAEGRLQASEENFERIVGARAGDLEPLPPLPPLPMSSDQAVATTLASNADIVAFVARARAAEYDVAATKSLRSPTLSVVGTVDYDNALGTADIALGVPRGTSPNSSTNVAAGFALRIPLYQGGAVSARVRQSEEVRAQLVEEAIAAERLVVANARTAFSIYRSALTAISFNELAVASNEKALESVKVAQTVGARSILDVLNAEQELLASKIALTTSRSEAYVAAFQLLNTMGAAEATALNIEVGPLYDPQGNYRKNSDVWSDWEDGSRQPPMSTRNVSSDADSPLTRLNDGSLDEAELDD